MSRPTYSDAHKIVERFAPVVLPLFADGWERFPTGQTADAIIYELTVQQGYWERAQQRAIDRGADDTGARENAQLIASAIAEIARRRD